MRKDFIIAGVSFLLIATPAYASQGNNKDNGNRQEENHGQAVAAEHRESEEKNNNIPEVQVALPVVLDVSPTVTLTTTPAPSSQERDEKDEEKNHGVKAAETSAETTEECDSEGDWKNHGEYVSCVAKLHVGGDEVSEAARTDVGKKSDEHGDGPSVTPTLSTTPTITPPLTAPVAEVHLPFLSWEEFKNAIGRLFRGFHFGR
ncbi:MAG: hypothetical protein Q8Q49_06080 [bacterium]|nr:hypothetical protein [bacterium]